MILRRCRTKKAENPIINTIEEAIWEGSGTAAITPPTGVNVPAGTYPDPLNASIVVENPAGLYVISELATNFN